MSDMIKDGGIRKAWINETTEELTAMLIRPFSDTYGLSHVFHVLGENQGYFMEVDEESKEAKPKAFSTVAQAKQFVADLVADPSSSTLLKTDEFHVQGKSQSGYETYLIVVRMPKDDFDVTHIRTLTERFQKTQVVVLTEQGKNPRYGVFTEDLDLDNPVMTSEFMSVESLEHAMTQYIRRYGLAQN